MKVHLVALILSFVWCVAGQGHGLNTPLYTAMAGDDLTVPCYAVIPGRIILCRNDCSEKTNIVFDSWNITRTGSRYSVVHEESNPDARHVRIKNVSVSDSGTYVCQQRSGKGFKQHQFVVSVIAGPRHHHWLVFPVVMVMISVLVFGICMKKKKSVNAHYDENNEIDLELAGTSSFPPEEFQTEEYENMRTESESVIYQSLCVETMDPNQTYYSVSLD